MMYNNIMQTFVPYASFSQSALVLDDARLRKQQVEAEQILKVLFTNDPNKKGWRNHPAVLQWKDYPDALQCYLEAIPSVNFETPMLALRLFVRRGTRPPLRLLTQLPRRPIEQAVHRMDHKTDLCRCRVASLHVIVLSGARQTAVYKNVAANNGRNMPVTDADIVKHLVRQLSTLDCLAGLVPLHTVIWYSHLPHDMMAVGNQELFTQHIGN